MPSKKEWIEAIKACGEEESWPACPLCKLAKRRVNKPEDSRRCERCIFSLYEPNYCITAMHKDIGLSEKGFFIRVKEHKEKFLIPFVEELSNDHPFWGSNPASITRRKEAHRKGERDEMA